MADNRSLGRLGEGFAAELLEMDGYTIVERNFFCRAGEIDLICEKEGEICFVEVKTRRSTNFGTPAEAICREKIGRMRRAALFYLQTRQWEQKEISFQVIEIVIHQIPNAF